jgi:hypothetical protein
MKTEGSDEIYVLSIDIGIQHLGLSMNLLNHDYTFKEVLWIDMIDISNYSKLHRYVSCEDCQLYHTRTFTDWVEHLVQENEEFFEAADVVLIERQPPTGFVAIEQLLFSKFRKKAHLIHPRNVHSYLNFHGLDYEKRKELSVKIANRIMPDKYKDQLLYYERHHDIADSICMTLYWKEKKHKEWKRKMNLKKAQEDFGDIFEKLESFRYYS